MQNKTWRDDIRAYVPFNEQERNDKARFLEVLDLENILTRENEEAHVSSSAWVMNDALDQVLMAYHNIYQSYSWLGGHADGDPDLFAVALREAKEESGITELTPFSQDILALDILPGAGPYQAGQAGEGTRTFERDLFVYRADRSDADGQSG